MWIFMVNHNFEGDSSRYKNFEREEKKKEELCVQAMVCLNSTKTNINIYLWARLPLLSMTTYIIPEVDPAQ